MRSFVEKTGGTEFGTNKADTSEMAPMTMMNRPTGTQEPLKEWISVVAIKGAISPASAAPT